jgi:sec-independent protein translocase protein TatA
MQYNRVYGNEVHFMGDLFTPGHIILVVLVALLFFGPSKLPELGRGFGKMLREFKSGAKGLYAEDDANTDSKHIVQKERSQPPQIVESKPADDERRLP